LPGLQREFPALLSRLAAGLAGPGSECFGVDDELSRDHDWGPGFCLWLPEQDALRAGAELQAWYDRLPKEFGGFGPRRTSPGEEHRTGVCAIPSFFRRHTGLDRAPPTLRDWLSLSEEGAAACTNGAVFTDAPGAFSAWRAVLAAYYPEDLRLKKLAAHGFLAGQSAQYNYPRTLRRSDPFTLRYLEVLFCSEALAVVFALNRRFLPFFKWRRRLAEGLPLFGRRACELVQGVLSAPGQAEKMSAMEQACAELIRVLQEQGVTDSASGSLLEQALAVNARIGDRVIRDEVPFA